MYRSSYITGRGDSWRVVVYETAPDGSISIVSDRLYTDENAAIDAAIVTDSHRKP